MAFSKARRPPRAQERRRLECPVCLGAALEGFRPSAGSPLVIDACRRCGGIWFDAGEVPLLRTLRQESLMRAVTLSPEAFRMKCHQCLASFERNLPACTACGWKNQLSCPVCRVTLKTVEHDTLRLDACTNCRGVWFDNVELAAIWNGKVSAMARKQGQALPSGTDSDHFLLHSVLWMPDPFLAGYVVASGAEALGHAAQGLAPAAGAIVEGTGELAGSLFDTIGEIIAGIFDGI